MKYESAYIDLTGKMIDYFKDKENKKVKEYILVCHNYINELRNLDVLSLMNDLEYERAFNELLSLVEETYRPDKFVSCVDNSIIRIFEDEFIVYMLAVKKQLKRPIQWAKLCELNYNFGILKIQYDIKPVKEDFTTFAITNIKLIDLWKILKN